MSFDFAYAVKRIAIVIYAKAEIEQGSKLESTSRQNSAIDIS